MKIYFAGSIRGGREDRVFYAGIIDILSKYGEVLTEHIGNAEIGPGGEALSDREIFDRDFAWLKSADCVVAEVTNPSLGVGYEIGVMSETGKPVYCLYRPAENKVLSAMIAGNERVKVRNYSGLDEVDSILKDFFGFA